ncbi:late competence protein ComER [Thalassobacillus sp. CUG 92003]|uniref:late competence protein ComER n=1 Tax=Thalassobacillus sp. CUG 92003 TaxID=2736641 RepID=UPI0015E7B12C|nr:late competence protein ComER [Thalassobacillus sp. CUG 92003]
MKWGIIGIGNMGGILAKTLISSGAIEADKLSITNRTRSKAEAFQQEYPDVNIEETAADVAKKSDIIVISVKPADYKHVIRVIKPVVTQDSCIVSITSPVSVSQLETALSCQVARIVPSITNQAFAGVSLVTAGRHLSRAYEEILLQTFKHFSKPVHIQEEHIRVSSDIVSCGPAFISSLMEHWIKAASDVAGIPKATATTLTGEMLIGYGKLLSTGVYDLSELTAKVRVKGGVTGEGLDALEKHRGELFQHMFEATQAKHRRDKAEITLD